MLPALRMFLSVTLKRVLMIVPLWATQIVASRVLTLTQSFVGTRSLLQSKIQGVTGCCIKLSAHLLVFFRRFCVELAPVTVEVLLPQRRVCKMHSERQYTDRPPRE